MFRAIAFVAALSLMLVASLTGQQAGAGESPPSEDLGTIGDVDCDGDVDVVDALGISRYKADLDVGQAQPCDPIGSKANILDDLNCDGAVDLVDSMLVLRHVAGLPRSSPPGCSAVGGHLGYIAVDNFQIDMDPGASPGNTDSSVGSIEPCARINENDVLDADEEDVDVLDADIVAGPLGFSEDHPMIAFEFEIEYPAGARVIAKDLRLLLAQNDNANIFEAFVDPLPDSDGAFHAGALDLNSNTPEHAGDIGPGALTRLRLEAMPGFPPRTGEVRIGTLADGDPGIFAVDTSNLALFAANMEDTNGDGLPDTVPVEGSLAFDMACPDPLPAR